VRAASTDRPVLPDSRRSAYGASMAGAGGGHYIRSRHSISTISKHYEKPRARPPGASQFCRLAATAVARHGLVELEVDRRAHDVAAERGRRIEHGYGKRRVELRVELLLITRTEIVVQVFPA